MPFGSGRVLLNPIHGEGHQMCGIFGYVGSETDVGPAVLDALKVLEYGGYDSWGVGVAVDGLIEVQKQPGKIATASVDFPPADIGFGHTRWATHGGVTQANAHPHLAETGRLAVIHNGIVENFRQLRDDLVADGHTFRSGTDTEVIAHLLEREFASGEEDTLRAFQRVFQQLDGLSAVIALDLGSRSLIAAKSVSPLVVGRGKFGVTIASDALALRGHADEIVYLDDTDLVHLSRDGAAFYDRATLSPKNADWLPLDLEDRDL